MPKILHIINDYSGSTVYMNLIRELDSLGVEQVVYSPVRDKKQIGKNAVILNNRNSKIIYSHILNAHIDRIFYPYKILKIFRDIQKQVDFSQIDFIHAHTWYSDGGVAYFLAKKYNIPFILTVRSTDLNIFYKKLVYLRSFGRRLLAEAKNIILISASSEPKLLELSSLKDVIGKLKDKIHIIPNGVDPYWINNAVVGSSRNACSHHKKINLIYVGTFIERKKLVEIQHAVIQLNKSLHSQQIHLHIVGGGGENEAKVLALVEQQPKYFTYHGKIYDKEKLADLYHSSDIFVMPSMHETFGLVYVEALLQGLPILYMANEGIDGFYSDNIGEKVLVADTPNIVEKLELMIENLNHYDVPTLELQRNHDWAEIAKQYLSIYKTYL